MRRFLFISFILLAVFYTAIQLSAASGAGPSLLEMTMKSGPLMIVLFLLSFATLCLTFYFFFSLREKLIVPEHLATEFEEKKKDLEIMGRICKDDDSPLAKIILAGIETVRKPNITYAILRDAIEDEGSRQGAILWNRIQFLQDIVVIAPMVGLLGNVLGMIRAFGALSAEMATPRPTIIASGVALALTTTFVGILIGVFAMMFYAYFRTRVNDLISKLESNSNKISRELFRFIIQEKEEEK